jgi:hypothetical protein
MLCQFLNILLLASDARGLAKDWALFRLPSSGQRPLGNPNGPESYSLMATPLKAATPTGVDVATAVRSP